MPNHQMHLAVVLPEWDTAIAIGINSQKSLRYLVEDMIERDLLNQHYRYSCEFVTGEGHVLDFYLPVYEQGITGGEILYMRVRQAKQVHA